jgi:hypothetical protein
MDENEARAWTGHVDHSVVDDHVTFPLRVPILPILPALVVTLVLAGLVWVVTG